ncbi:hypothetical protein CPB84DRAFT_863339 [Gymnopilus junonius]|uniref:Uncharacterized protein n=1 Tax=Gymnopilus junonius TaxID=109634 RepID=A0A9P5TN98_GYMJU|nr:hypothetical protein CPB84DRAFT_863339 [Gymnopilus junonius]
MWLASVKEHIHFNSIFCFTFPSNLFFVHHSRVVDFEYFRTSLSFGIKTNLYIFIPGTWLALLFALSLFSVVNLNLGIEFSGLLSSN